MKLFKLIPHKIERLIVPEFVPGGVKKGHSRRKYLYAIEKENGKYILLLVKYGNFYVSNEIDKEEIHDKFGKLFLITRSSKNLKFIPERAIKAFSMQKVPLEDLFLKVFRECVEF